MQLEEAITRLTEIEQRIQTALDEEQFARIVKRLGIRKFTARMLQIVSDDLYLGEGFLPMPPLNDRGTQRLRSKLLH